MNFLFRKKLKKYGMYAFERGDKTGTFGVYVEENNIFNSCAFLLMPFPLEIIYFNKDDIENSLNDGTLVFVKRLPKDVYDVCKANFDHLKKK